MTLDYVPASDLHGVYAFVLEGEVERDGTALGRRDSTGVWGAERIQFRTGEQETDMLIVESAP